MIEHIRSKENITLVKYGKLVSENKKEVEKIYKKLEIKVTKKRKNGLIN